MAIYYMRDNHTFKKLSRANALTELEAELDAGRTHGMLCASARRTFLEPIHHHGDKEDFLRRADDWLKAYDVFNLGAGI